MAESYNPDYAADCSRDARLHRRRPFAQTGVAGYMRRLQRSVWSLIAAAPAFAGSPSALTAQPTASDKSDAIAPLLPPGISDFDLELFTRLANTWQTAGGDQVVLCRGGFAARMGQHRLSSRHAVIWFRPAVWEDKRYYDMELFLWQDGLVEQPGGTVETGPALLVTLRTFGKIVINADATARGVPDEDSDLYKEALRARGLLEVVPAAEPQAAPQPVQISPTAEEVLIRRPKPPKRIDFSAQTLDHLQFGDQSVFIVTGDVVVSQGSAAVAGEYLELRADAAVLYVNAAKLGAGVEGLFGEGPQPASQPPPDVEPAAEPTLTGDDRTDRQALQQWIDAVYLEGDVVLARGQRMIRASRLYYDFRNERALILDAVARAIEPSRGLPIYVRAEEIRQLSSNEYSARDAQITTSEFHTPHLSIGAGRVILRDRTPRNERGEIIGVEAGTYEATHTTLNLEGIPIAYWPVSRGDFARDRMAFRSARFGYASDFGATLETRWYLFNLLGLEQPEGFDATFKLDYFTDRGPGVGIDMDYERKDYFGLFRGYYINDDGEDDLGDVRGGPPDHRNRGRVLWRHRQYLPKDWELTLELAYISDDQYLESFERNEWENAKDQETAIYLAKRQDNWQFSSLFNWRFNEFLTQTEHLPDVRFSLIGEPVTEWATFYHDSRVGFVRYRPDNRRLFDGEDRIDNTGRTGAVARGDTREELEFPLRLGPLNLTPYLAVRGTAWDDSTDRLFRDSRGGVGRIFGAYGLRGNVMFSRVDDTVESELLDLHRLRHVVKVDVAAFNAHANEPPTSLTPFDSGVEDIDDFGGAVIGLRQRFQTKRGGPGKWRTVDWITFDVEAGFFTDRRSGDRTRGDFIMARPEDSISSNFLRLEAQYRISDSTVLVYDGVYDTSRGNVGSSNISLAVERRPRLAYFLGWRYIHDIDSNLFGFGANYKLNEKHTVGFREFYDIGEGRNLQTEIVYVRRWPRWYTAVAFNVDRTLDDIGITVSIWPEGAPRLGLGSKRYTGLSESVGIRPQ